MNLPLIVSIVAIAVGSITIINSLSKWHSNIQKRKKTRLEKLAAYFGGNWNNQGQKINRPSHYIDFDGWGDANKLNGDFNVRNSDDENSWEMFRLSSTRRYKAFQCQIFRIKDGVKTLVAQGLLRKHPDGLHWTLREGSTNQFPKEALLKRGLPKIA